MPKPSETALKGRARTLIEAMTERSRWIYAVPREGGEGGKGSTRTATVTGTGTGAGTGTDAGAGTGADAGTATGPGAALVHRILETEGLRCEERDPGTGVARFANETRAISFVVFDSPELEVLLIEAAGGDAPKILAKILEKTGFYAQSRLLGTALDVRDAEAPKALRTLAHMVVAWDEDWSDLFLLHLASPDPVVRHEAALGLSIATMVARDPGPAVELLTEAIRRETFPKLRETMREALNLVEGMSGGPVEVAPEPSGGDRLA